MECNKEEAIRAKVIAETRMRGKDFVGARKIALKAQKLFPGLENLSQMLTVCEVHCSAASEVNGEKDWYRILQVEPTAEVASIKKQYQKLAFLVHPDKNKFSGAEAAFKLIGEAHRMLSDSAKRAIYDLKRGVNFKTASLRQPAHQTRKQPGGSGNAAKNTTAQYNDLNMQQPPLVSSSQTFWTECPSCSIRYQYYRIVMNRSIRCQGCSRPFVACNLNAQPSGAKLGSSSKHSGNPQQECVSSVADNVDRPKTKSRAPSSGMGFQGNVGGGSPASELRSGFSTKFDGESKAKEDGKVDKGVPIDSEIKSEKLKLQGVDKKEQVEKLLAKNLSHKRSRDTEAESSDAKGSDSDDLVIVGDGHSGRPNIGTTGGFYSGRSTTQNQKVSCNEGDDVNIIPIFKRLKKDETSCDAHWKSNALFEGNANGVRAQPSENAVSGCKTDENLEGNVLSEKNIPNGMHSRGHGASEREGLNSGASSKAKLNVKSEQLKSTDLETFSYPIPEFCDFEKERDASKFAVNQIWALYADLDGMPRYYAWITQVCGPEFKLHFTWLEPDPIGKDEMKWLEEDLPVGCGNFRLGSSEYTQDRLMFSHLMPWKKDVWENSCVIHPRRGEVWALFKDWDITWSSDADKHRHYEFEVVEVISDYEEDYGINVFHLVKVKEFVCLFMRALEKGAVPAQIPAKEILRFSHKIPSYRMTGEEREGIPEVSFELDAASLPVNFEETYPSISVESGINLRAQNLDNLCNGSHYESTNNDGNQAWTTHNAATELQKHAKKVENDDLYSNTSNAVAHQNAPQPASPICFEYSDAEFHDFDAERSSDKFQSGQIWALYSDIDKYPKYYYRITEVDLEDFKVHGTWLEACFVREEEMQWLKEDLPVVCGTFRIVHGTVTFDTALIFSHLVQAKSMWRRDHYEIYPTINQVWALYKHWNFKWSCADLQNSEYIVVEILAHTSSGIKVLVLTKVDGYRAVFMPESKGATLTTIEIPEDEYLRFSHRIPAFQLTAEGGGNLEGYWELDPASMPDVYCS